MRKSVAAVIAASAAISGCGQSHAENGGPAVSRTYNVGNFLQIEGVGPYDVVDRPGVYPCLFARGSQYLTHRTLVENNGDKLVIHPGHRHSSFICDRAS